MSTETQMTAEQLLRMPDDGNRYELVAGELKMMSPAGGTHGRVAARLNWLLYGYVEAQRLGEVFAAETGFLLSRDPDTVRAPDVACVRAARLPPQTPAEAYWPVVPDLVAEVLSPDTTIRELDRKVRDWLGAGCRAVWVVDPEAHTITVHRSATDVALLTEQDDLEGGDVVPGFRCPVADVFARL